MRNSAGSGDSEQGELLLKWCWSFKFKTVGHSLTRCVTINIGRKVLHYWISQL